MSAAAAARAEGQRFEYKRREPQSQVLHRLVREHLEPFLAYTREHYRKPLPKYVERELRGLLRCGEPNLAPTTWWSVWFTEGPADDLGRAFAYLPQISRAVARLASRAA